MNAIARDITAAIRGKVSLEAPLAPLSSWQIGGTAALLVEPVDIAEIITATTIIRAYCKALYIIGNASNVLIDDAGLPGVVLRLHGSNDIVITEGKVIAAAGVMLPVLASRAAKAGLVGFNFLCDIPGTVGGAVVGNAGTGGLFGPSVSQIVTAVNIIDLNDGLVKKNTATEMQFSHRSSVLQSRSSIVLSAEFVATGFEASEVLTSQQHELRQRRHERNPRGYSVGSVFKFSEPYEHPDKAPAWYIDQAGLKGLRIGGAIVSPQHANWIINDQSATSADMLTLMNIICDEVMSKFQVKLINEVQYLY